jgi:Fe-S-cluster containining protein
MKTALPVLNLAEARYECIYGRGCDGICCQNGRPGVHPEEAQHIDEHLDTFLPLLRPEARALIEEEGFLSQRRKTGLRMLRVVKGWCVFFNQGCVLHKVGAAEGESYRYKPSACALFPIAKDQRGRWYVRQWGYKGEAWDLFCLNPKASPRPAARSLRTELSLAQQFDAHAAERESPKRVNRGANGTS